MLNKLIRGIVEELPLFTIVVLLLCIPASYGILGKFAVTAFVGSFLISLFYATIIVALSKFTGRWLLWLIISILIVLFTIETVSFFKFGSRMSPVIMTIILQTDYNETQEFFQEHLSNLIYLIIPFILIIIFFVYICRKWRHLIKKKNIQLKSKYIFILLIGYLLIFVAFQVYAKNKRYEIPLDKTSIHELISAFSSVSGNNKDIEYIHQANKNIKILSNHTDSTIIILVIGESFNKYHSSLYGYQQETNPYLKKQQKSGNLFVFNDVVTPFSVTENVMQYLFSLKSYNDETEWKNNALFPAVFKKAGYQVGYFDNQYSRKNLIQLWDYSMTYFMNPEEISQQCFTLRTDSIFQYDEDFVNFYSTQFLSNPKSLNIIHLMGQHIDASQRFPHKSMFNHFKNKDYSRKDLNPKELNKVAEYDNATLYNDNVVNKIFNLFKDKDAIAIYFTDHGEQLYDDERKAYGRKFGDHVPPQAIRCVYEIPFVIWCSDKYIANHHEMVENIKKSVDKPFSNDDTAYLLFDLAGIESNVNKPERSVINNRFSPKERIIDRTKINYDRIKEKVEKTKLLIMK